MSIARKTLKINSLIFAVGMTASIGQLALIRLTAQSFNGNELTMCVAIGHWLLWTGIGSLAGSRVVEKKPAVNKLFGLVFIYVVLLLAAADLLILIRRLIGMNISEMLGLGRIFLWTGLLFMPPGLVDRFAFYAAGVG